MINREWHLKNRLGSNAKIEVRMKWHIEHMKNCNCRKPSEKLMKEIEEYKKGRKK